MRSAQDILADGQTTTEEGLALFDSLEPVNQDFMLGAWAGSGLASRHPMDGLLEHYGWHGKLFDSTESVHPLVFKSASGRLVRLGPRRLFSGLVLARWPSLARSSLMAWVLRLSMPLLQTGRSRARLRLIEHRGKVTAAMQYDNLPINDVFAKIDEDTVLGVMDLKGMTQPFFFLLRREKR